MRPVAGKKRYPLDGYNPKRYDCRESGCFEVKRRPQIELFADCFPGRNNFGDIDYCIERYGHLLIVEWKMPGEELTGGQKLQFERITKPGRYITVIVAWGDAQSARIERYKIYHNGFNRDYIGNLEKLKDRIFDWDSWASKNSLVCP